MAKRELKCETCQYYIEKECTHQSNIGVRIRNRRQTDFFVDKAKDLEKNCKNYKENGI